MRLREVIFSSMVRQEIGWFDQPENKIGILTSRLAVDATIVRGVRFHHDVFALATRIRRIGIG